MPRLDWIGCKAVENHYRQVPFHLLKEAPELSVGDPRSGNLLVEGDNLLTLKALLPYYAGQVRCIYIDPPYNTGNENWVYNDNVNSPEMREWLGKVVGKEAEDLSRHDKWLCMMYPRLALLWHFLRDDGAIFISIDDNEGVKYWVRNVERKTTSFSLQTSTDRFYPDFICKLEDGRILVVEYKSSRDWDLPDCDEKRRLGALWEMRSNGKGLFIMPCGKDFEEIRKKVRKG